MFNQVLNTPLNPIVFKGYAINVEKFPIIQTIFV